MQHCSVSAPICQSVAEHTSRWRQITFSLSHTHTHNTWNG